MNAIKRLIQEVHRRSLWQVLGIYSVGSWAAYQVIGELTDRIGMPDWVPGFAVVLFLIGLPIVLATAFVQEGMPIRTPEAPQPDPRDVPERTAEPAPVQERRASVLPPPARPHAFLTWQRSLLAGIIAFLLLGLTAGGYMGLRQAGVGPFASLISSGALENRDRILVSELEHAGGDDALAAALTEALRVDLAQSPVVTIVERRVVTGALQRMGRDPQAALDASVAREVALREGIKAVLEGEIAPAAGRHMLTVRLVHPSTGELLFTHRETAADSSDVIPAVDRLSKKLREGIGESLRTIRRDAPLEAVSTASLTALQRYTQAVRASDVERDWDRAISLLHEALAADSTFAMAWRKLAVAYSNSGGGRDRQIRAATRAYELRDRLTDRERYHTIASYHLIVTGDEPQAIQAYRSLLDIHPDDYAALNNLALTYGRIRDYERAVEYYARSIAADSSNGQTYTNLAIVQYALGWKDEAKATMEFYRHRFPDQRQGTSFVAHLAVAEGRYDEAERLARELVAASRESAAARAASNALLGSIVLMRGQLAEFRRQRREVMEANRARGLAASAIAEEVVLADLEQWLLQRPTDAVRRLDAVLASGALEEVPNADRPYPRMATVYARSGRPDRAREIVVLIESAPVEEVAEPNVALAYANGWIALAEDRPDAAIAEFRTALVEQDCRICAMPDLAAAYDAAAQRDSAIAYYRRYIETPAMVRTEQDAWALARTYERLAELYEEAGDRENAMRFAGLFVQLWENADAELQPRVREKQHVLQRLTRG